MLNGKGDTNKKNEKTAEMAGYRMTERKSHEQATIFAKATWKPNTEDDLSILTEEQKVPEIMKRKVEGRVSYL